MILTLLGVLMAANAIAGFWLSCNDLRLVSTDPFTYYRQVGWGRTVILQALLWAGVALIYLDPLRQIY